MGTWGNNLSVLPFYESLEEQDFRQWYAYGENYRLLASGDYVLPFFFCVPYTYSLYHALTNGTNPEIRLVNVCGCAENPYPDPSERGAFSMDFNESFYRYNNGGLDFYHLFSSNGLHFYNTGTSNDDWVVFYYNANPITSMGIDKGLYYIVFEVANPNDPDEPFVKRYSDIFTVGDTNNTTKLSWSFNSRLNPFMASVPSIADGFTSWVYLDTEIGMPDYESTEEGEERNGYFFPIKQLSQKTYHMNFVAPEYLCDALRLVFMADTITVVDRLQRTYECNELHTEVNWLEQGHYAEVKCDFQTDLVVKKIGKAY